MHNYTAAESRFYGLWEELGRRLAVDEDGKRFYLELDAALGAKLVAAEDQVLDRVVIGVYDRDGFPGVQSWWSTRREGALVDECNHRAGARQAEWAESEGSPAAASALRDTVRASLERDLGNPEAADRLWENACAALRAEGAREATGLVSGT